MSIEQILTEHFKYGNREPELCGCGLLKWWAFRDEDLPESEQPIEQTWENHVDAVIREYVAEVLQDLADGVGRTLTDPNAYARMCAYEFAARTIKNGKS